MKRLLLCLHEHLFLQMLRTVKQLNQFKMSNISLKKKNNHTNPGEQYP